MAFDYRCTKCGHPEAAHDYADTGACESYQSPCPELEAELWDAKRKSEDALKDAMRRCRGVADNL